MFALLIPALLRIDVRARMNEWLTQRKYVALLFPLLAVLISGLWSSDTSLWLERMRIMLPLAGLGFAFSAMPKLAFWRLHMIWFFFLFVMAVSISLVLGNYAFNMVEIQDMMRRGQPMPVPKISHIRFSLLCVTAAIGGVDLIRQGAFPKRRWLKTLVWICTIILIVGLHILSVRSGLLALYVSLFGYAVMTAWVDRKFVLLGIVALGCTLAPMAAYQLPSVRQKVDYTLWDLKMYREGNISEYSDARRWVSLGLGLELGKSSPLLGVGAGDVKPELKKLYAARYPDQPVLLPHNQYIYTFAAMGALGVVALLALIVALIWTGIRHKHPLLIAITLMFVSSMLVETTLETAVGMAAFLVPLLIAFLYLDRFNARQSQEE